MSFDASKRQASGSSKILNRRILPPVKLIVSEAAKIEALSRDLLHTKLGIKENFDVQIDEYPKIHNLNSFGKQIVIQMMRSNPSFKGFKIDLKDHILSPHILFLAGTLCGNFDHMNTSPLYGFKVLDIGCGALSSYAPSPDDEDLLVHFYNDHPPIAAEILQILGAQVTGIEPRPHNKQEYSHPLSYKHKVMEFSEIGDWLPSAEEKFDVIACLHLFSRSDFLYTYSSPEQITDFFRNFRKAISPQGLLYTSVPLLPASPENQETNQQIFREAGFKVIYEGYYWILEPV
ncbi:bifunctional 2-polyprenyl-6-hydroxyphenol methylase/3-demethylubiquinol 3-O-methyltransferase UbiG [Trichocoleus sp. FACHB-46]|uniref:class I SAM-dependent methyltransferase n=1 Tax=Trichocoleus sp. FACHB-46 TaxID=2692871 RepID=UPI0016836C40|nr:hypothetical protein [Trichocoleus sp. FACHB-46]MBD1863789.1 hypothetical protein [Trichocoleus sp. FACHB-46]